MKYIKSYAIPILILTITILIGLSVNSATAECPCLSQDNDQYSMLPEQADATSNSSDVDMQPMQLASTDDSPQRNQPARMEIDPNTKPSSAEVTPPAKPTIEEFKEMIREGFVEYKKALDAKDYDHALELKNKINLYYSEVRAAGEDVPECAKDIQLLGHEKVLEAAWKNNPNNPENDPRFTQMTAGMDKESFEYEKVTNHAIELVKTAKRVQRALDFGSEEEANYWRHSIQQSINLFHSFGLDPSPYRELVENAGCSIEASNQEHYTADTPPFEVAENPPMNKEDLETQRKLEEKGEEIPYEVAEEIMLQQKLGDDRNPQYWGKDGMYSEYRPENEMLARRGRTTKHFIRPDGQIDAIVNVGSVHYQDEEGLWREIDTRIQLSDNSEYAFENKKNSLKSFYPESNIEAKGVTVRAEEGEFTISKSPSIVLLDDEGNSEVLEYIENVDGIIAKNKINYKHSFISADIEFEIEADRIKQNIILNRLPEGTEGKSGYLGYSEIVSLPEGWSLQSNGQSIESRAEVSGGLVVVDSKKNPVVTFPTPDVYEANNRDENILNPDGTTPDNFGYIVSKVGLDYEITTRIPLEWLTADGREYPVIIDPDVYDYGDYGGWQNSGGSYVNNNYYVFTGYYYGNYYNAYVRWNPSGISSSDDVTYVGAYFYMNGTNTSTGYTTYINDVTTYFPPYSSYNYSYWYELENSAYTSFTAYGSGRYYPSSSSYYSLGSTACSHLEGHTTYFAVGLECNNSCYKRFTAESCRLKVTYVPDPCACPPYSYYGTYYPGYNWYSHYSSSTSSSTFCRWYRLYLYGGYEYNFTTVPGVTPSSTANFDTYLELYNSSCSRVAYNDDAFSLQSFISYCPSSSGYYWLKIRGYGSSTGSYTVGMCRFSSYGSPTSIWRSASAICQGSYVDLDPSGGYGGDHYLTYGNPGTCGSEIDGGWVDETTERWYPPAPSGWSTTYTVYDERRCGSGSYYAQSCKFGATMGSGGAVSTTVRVDATSQGGTISASHSTVCEGASVTFQTTGGQVGAFQRFQYRWNGSGGWTNWATSDPYTWTASSPGNYLQVRAVIKNGVCGEAYSNSVNVTVVNDPTASVSGGGTVCWGSSRTLTCSISGGTGSYTYQWQFYNGSSWVNISGATSSTYAANPSSATGGSTQYRCYITCSGNGCNSDYSNTEWVYLYNNGTSVGQWVGNYNQYWDDCRNWGHGKQPTSSDNVTIPTGVSNWPHVRYGGEVSANLTVNSSARLYVDSGGDLLAYGQFNNYGTVYHNGTSLECDDNHWYNRAGAVYNQTSGNGGQNDDGGWVHLYNYGTINLSGGTLRAYDYFYNQDGGTTNITGGYFWVEDPAYNYEDINISSGEFECNATDAHLYNYSGAIIDLNSGVLDVDGNLYNYATVRNDGGTHQQNLDILNYSSGTYTQTNGTTTINGSYRFENMNGTLNVSGGSFDAGSHLYNMNGYSSNDMNISGGTVHCNAIPNYEGRIDHTGGTIQNTGYYRENDAGGGNYYGSGSAVLNLNGSSYVRLMRSGSYFNDVNVNGTYNFTSDCAYDWNINGDFTIGSSGSFNSTYRDILLQGNWTNNGSFTHGSRRVSFDGSSNSLVGGTNSTTFYELEVNKPSASYYVRPTRSIRITNLDVSHNGYFDATTGVGPDVWVP